MNKPLEYGPDDFVAADGSVQTLTAADYAQAADMMLAATEDVPEEIQPKL